MSRPGSLLLFCRLLHSSKISLVLVTKVTHLHSFLFRQSDGVNCVVRRVYLGGCPKTESVAQPE